MDVHFATRYSHSLILFSSNRYSVCNQVHSSFHTFLIKNIFFNQVHSLFSYPIDMYFATRFIDSFILFPSKIYIHLQQIAFIHSSSSHLYLYSFTFPIFIHSSIFPSTHPYIFPCIFGVKFNPFEVLL